MGYAPIPDLDKEAFDVYQEVKHHGRGAKKLGINETTFKHRVHRHRKRMELDAIAPPGYFVKGTSTLRNSKDEIVAQWIKTAVDPERMQMLLLEALTAMEGHVEPVPAVAAPDASHTDLCAFYVLSDYHLGMFAHADEGGADWSLDIAEAGLKKWARAAVDMAPPAEQAVFLQNGDFLHFDGLEPVTPRGKHVLDADSRFQKIVAAGIKGIRYAVELMLQKHQRVHLIMSDANHDPSSSVWLRAMFAALYENEPRVTVDRTEHPYYCFEWGLTSIFSHHGDKRNINNVSHVVAALYREVFGRTKHSYCHLGHVHHSASKEDSLMRIIVHPTLAAKDAYAARFGYISQRAARTFIYHKEFGEVGCLSITPEMLK